MKIKATDDFLRDLHQPADKCLVVGEPEMLVPLEEKLRQELGKRINVYRSEAFYLELVPKGIDKAASLSRLLERTRIKQEEVIAIGDGFNDVSMIRFAGLGVAMANAQPPVKANADRITQYTNDEDGVAHPRIALKKTRTYFPRNTYMFSREHVRVFSETFTPVSTQANAYIGISLYVYRRKATPI